MQPKQQLNHYLANEFYANHSLWLTAWLKKKLGYSSSDILDAADLTHDTFLSLMLKKDLAAIIEPRAYLTHIAHGLLVTRVRRRDLERSYLDALKHLSPAEAPSPELRLIVLEALINLDRLLDGLSPNVRNAFLLVQLEGKSYTEIANQLNVSTRTVGNYIAKAMLHCLSIKED